MEMSDAAWLPSTSPQAAAAEQRYRDIIAGKLAVTIATAAPTPGEPKKEKGKKEGKAKDDKKKEKKGEEDSARRRLPRYNYFIRPSTHPSFFPGRATDLYVNGQKVTNPEFQASVERAHGT